MDKALITDEEIELFLAEEAELTRHRDAGTLFTPNMTKYLSETFNHDTTFAARALLDMAIASECQVRETAAAWAGTGIAMESAALIVSAAQDEASTVDAETFAFFRTFITHWAANPVPAGNNVVEFYPHRVIAEWRATKPDTEESRDQLWAAACYKAWWGAAVQLEELARRYGPS